MSDLANKLNQYKKLLDNIEQAEKIIDGLKEAKKILEGEIHSLSVLSMVNKITVDGIDFEISEFPIYGFPGGEASPNKKIVADELCDLGYLDRAKVSKLETVVVNAKTLNAAIDRARKNNPELIAGFVEEKKLSIYDMPKVRIKK